MNPGQLYTVNKIRNEQRLREAALVREVQVAQDGSSLMPTLSPVTARRLRLQGFSELDKAALAELAPLAARRIGGLLSCSRARDTAGAADPAVDAMLPGEFWALSGWHPFDFPYTFVLRRVRHTASMPRYGPPRRFACLIATMWLGATGGVFAVGLPLLGPIVGAALTVATAIAASADFCAGCYIYWRLITFSASTSGHKN